jgi:rubredoxin
MNTQRHICTICNYIYEQPTEEVDQVTTKRLPFEELPEDWKHGDCAGTKEHFQPCTCVSWKFYEATIARSA